MEIRLRNVGMLGLDGSRQCMNVGLLAVNILPKLVLYEGVLVMNIGING